MASSQVVNNGGCVQKGETMMALGIFLLLIQGVTVGRCRHLSAEEDLELDGQLKLLSKPVIKSIQSGSDLFDCIDINKQPAFDHPLLKNHQLKLKPSSYPKDFSLQATPLTNLASKVELDSEGCPEGTVPILRVTRDDLIRAKPFWGNYANQGRYSTKEAPYGPDEFTQVALKRVSGDFYYGAMADIAAYGLPQVGQAQYSSSLVRIANLQGETGPKTFIQAGLTVNNLLFNDTNTRLFVSWTPNFPDQFGCYNLLCPGFMQTSQQIPIGTQFNPLSTVHGPQYVVRIVIFQDAKNGNWWLALDKDPSKVVGYWPRDIFGGWLDKANIIHLGGIVHSPANVPLPPMGSGHFPQEGLNVSAFVENAQYVDVSDNYHNVLAAQTDNFVSKPACYDVGGFYNVGGGPGAFFFGGSGNC